MRCNMDCLNCLHPDCIQPYTIDREIYNDEYYEKNREEILRKQMEYYYANHEEMKKARRDSWALHKDKYNARRREKRKKLAEIN